MNAPRKGDRGTYAPPNGETRGFTVVRVDGSICWADYDGSDETSCFIWQFKDGLNAYHIWPGKDAC